MRFDLLLNVLARLSAVRFVLLVNLDRERTVRLDVPLPVRHIDRLKLDFGLGNQFFKLLGGKSLLGVELMDPFLGLLTGDLEGDFDVRHADDRFLDREPAQGASASRTHCGSFLREKVFGAAFARHRLGGERLSFLDQDTVQRRVRLVGRMDLDDGVLLVIIPCECVFVDGSRRRGNVDAFQLSPTISTKLPRVMLQRLS